MQQVITLKSAAARGIHLEHCSGCCHPCLGCGVFGVIREIIFSVIHYKISASYIEANTAEPEHSVLLLFSYYNNKSPANCDWTAGSIRCVVCKVMTHRTRIKTQL